MSVDYLGAVLGVDDLNELGLEAGAAHEEAVDVGLGAQGGGRAGVDAAAVNDAHLKHDHKQTGKTDKGQGRYAQK